MTIEVDLIRRRNALLSDRRAFLALTREELLAEPELLRFLLRGLRARCRLFDVRRVQRLVADA